ncbi:MAG TPA: SAM-dependent methyltransferase [Burkholderiales bacterium]|nr:SAM-dependent methyltransferase [Burkholderiales bacterium]
MEEPLINDVSDTAFWVAHYRAQESARADALFRDPFAGRLASERGARIAAGMPAARMTAWLIAMRTVIIDDIILAAVRTGADCVLNLGAGLDARPYRLELPASLQWIEADYARVVEYKQENLAAAKPRCKLDRVKIDLAEPSARKAFLADVNARFGNILVLTEGVVPYLGVEEAGELAGDLRANANMRHWLLDYFSKEAMKFRKRTRMNEKMRNAPFKFDPDDWFAFFRGHGWEAETIRYLTDEGDRRGRAPPFPLPARIVFRILSMLAPPERRLEMRRFSAYVLLRPAS